MAQTRTAIQARYDKAHTVSFHLKLNLKTDADVIQRLGEVDSKQGYIKGLIRKDIEGGQDVSCTGSAGTHPS